MVVFSSNIHFSKTTPGEERILRAQFAKDLVVACVGGGSNAIGMFSAFLEDKEALPISTTGQRKDHLNASQSGIIY